MALHKKYGFTIIELVVVVLVIGILSAVALPRVIGLARNAKRNVIASVSGNLKTAIELAHSEWVASSEPETITIDKITFYMGKGVDSYGWPQNLTNSNAPVRLEPMTADECLNLWNNLIKSPPSGKSDPASSGCTADNSCKFFVTTESSGNDLLCKFTDKDANYITYDRTSGNVVYFLNN